MRAAVICGMAFGFAAHLMIKSCAAAAPDPSHIGVPNKDASINFIASNGKTVLRISPDGAFYVNGRKTTSDKKIYRAVKQFFEGHCLQSYEPPPPPMDDRP